MFVLFNSTSIIKIKAKWVTMVLFIVVMFQFWSCYNLVAFVKISKNIDSIVRYIRTLESVSNNLTL